MNLVDLAVLGIVGILALLGLRMGMLVPVSGLAGLALGLVLAFQYRTELAAELVDYIDGETVRNFVAFCAIVLITLVAARTGAYLLKKLLALLQLGWVDRLAGGVLGAGLGLVVVGTAVYILGGADSPGIQDALSGSILAEHVASVSVLSVGAPWCAELRQANALHGLQDTTDRAAGCADFQGYARDLFGKHISDNVRRLFGHDCCQSATMGQIGTRED